MLKTPIARPLRIAECEPSEAGHLAEVYNALASSAAPFCPPISPEEFLVGMTEVHDKARPVTDWGLNSFRLISVARDSSIVGFAHVAIETRRWEEPTTRRGLIRVFTYDRADRAAGQTLLNAAEGFFIGRGLREVCASPWFAPVRFIFTGREGISTLHPHVLSLFSLNGYSVDRAQHIMDLRGMSACEPLVADPAVTVTVNHTSGVMPGFHIRLTRGGHEIGKCTCLGLGRQLRAREAQDRLLVRTIGVCEGERGAGLGRYLLQRALWEGQRLGYRDAHLRVSPDNHSAIMLYASEGFRIVGTGYELAKALFADPQAATIQSA